MILIKLSSFLITSDFSVSYENHEQFILTAPSRLGISKGVVRAQGIMWLKVLGVNVGEGFI